MKPRSSPFYQAIIQKLPFRRSMAAGALGMLCGRPIMAEVNQFFLKLDLRESIQRTMFLGTYEPEQSEWFRQCLSVGDTLIDVGASFGYYTTLGATLVGPSGKVFAFEPSPTASKVLEDAIKDAAAHNVILTKAAVGKANGSAFLYLPTTQYLHSPSILPSDSSFVPIEVSVVTLDQFDPLKSATQIKLVKMDVEGYEPDVLDGMETLIRNKRVENIICEFNSGWLRRNSTTTKQLLERFLDLGYRVRMQTQLQRNLVGHHGELFDLQDIWFSVS